MEKKPPKDPTASTTSFDATLLRPLPGRPHLQHGRRGARVPRRAPRARGAPSTGGVPRGALGLAWWKPPEAVALGKRKSWSQKGQKGASFRSAKKEEPFIT